jgi:Flp pilus assembly protein TadG
MRKLGKDQSGFSAIEAVLVIVIIGVIAFVGWDVLHAKTSSDKVLDAATKSSAAPATATTTKSTSTTASTASTQPAAGTDNTSLQTDLNSASAGNDQSNKDLGTTSGSLNDQSTFTSVPQ